MNQLFYNITDSTRAWRKSFILIVSGLSLNRDPAQKLWIKEKIKRPKNFSRPKFYFKNVNLLRKLKTNEFLTCLRLRSRFSMLCLIELRPVNCVSLWWKLWICTSLKLKYPIEFCFRVYQHFKIIFTVWKTKRKTYELLAFTRPVSYVIIIASSLSSPMAHQTTLSSRTQGLKRISQIPLYRSTGIYERKQHVRIIGPVTFSFPAVYGFHNPGNRWVHRQFLIKMWRE